MKPHKLQSQLWENMQTETKDGTVATYYHRKNNDKLRFTGMVAKRRAEDSNHQAYRDTKTGLPSNNWSNEHNTLGVEDHLKYTSR